MSSKGSSSTAPSSSISAATIEGNDDLLIEILLFLPVKSVVRFKVVSKRWRSLISAPFFCREHTLHQPQRHRETQPLIILGKYTSKYFVCNPTIPRIFSFDIHYGFPPVKILQSCNGLLLLHKKDGSGNRYYVFNPTTMQERELSPLPITSFVEIYLMFDPFLSPHYRVVCFVDPKNGTALVYLYDSETHEWKVGSEPLKMVMSYRNSKGFYFNGGICFPRFGNSPLYIPYDHNLSMIPNLPQHPPCSEYIVVESNRFLLRLTLCLWNRRLIVSEMKQNENRWTRKYEVDMNTILAKYEHSGGGKGHAIRLLGMSRGEKEQDSVLLFRSYGKIRIYKFYYDAVVDLYDNSIQFRKEHGQWCTSNVHDFSIQTLAPV